MGENLNHTGRGTHLGLTLGELGRGDVERALHAGEDLGAFAVWLPSNCCKKGENKRRSLSNIGRSAKSPMLQGQLTVLQTTVAA